MRFIDGTYDENTGISTVTIQYKGQYFTGTAKLHPEDKGSPLTGCRYAETRATIKALKYEYKLKKAAADACRQFVASLEENTNWDKESVDAKLVYHQQNIRIKEVNALADRINELEWNLRIKLNMQDRVNKSFESKND